MPPSAASRPAVRAFLLDTVISTVVPLSIYHLALRYGASEFRGLILSSLFPIAQSLFDLLRRRRLNPISLLVLLGIVVTIGALFLGGSPRILLIRESLLTAALGLSCLLSLILPRPLMFYFGRHIIAGTDPNRFTHFNRSALLPQIRRVHRTITLVWGCALLAEFAVRTWLVFHVPTSTVLAVAPILFNATILLTFLWTMRYSRQVSQLNAAAIEAVRPVA